MKQTFATVLLAAACLAACTGASAQQNVQVNIPFNFTVGDKLLPAGQYLITYGSQPKMIEFENRDKNTGAFALFMAADDVKQRANRIAFHKYGDQYFLSEYRGDLGSYSLRVNASKLETRARSQQAALVHQAPMEIALK